jgi:hypothetical protein
MQLKAAITVVPRRWKRDAARGLMIRNGRLVNEYLHAGAIGRQGR